MSTKNDIDYKNTHFEYPELTRIHGEPTTQNLITLQREIRANALTVHTVLGGGHYGHLGLVCPAATYNTIPNTQPYQRPVAPGPLEPVQGATQFQIQQPRETHAEATRLFREVLAVERTLIQQIVAAVDAKFLKALRDPVTNKITRTIPEILSHLFNAYGHVTPTELYELKQKVETMQFSPQEPVDTLITEIDDLADIADLAGSPITDRQRVDVGYIVLQRCKQFKTALREWNERQPNQQNWNNFKQHFRDAQISLRKTGEITVEEGLNHTQMVDMVSEGVRAALAEQEHSTEKANNIDETVHLRQQVKEMQELLENMNIAQQQSQMQQESHNKHFTPNQYPPYYMGQGNMYDPYVQQNGYQFQNWNNYNNQYHNGGGRGRGGRGNRGGRGGRGGRGYTPRQRKYCWSHGLTYHNGHECNNPMQGHKAEATLEDRMGGSNRGCNA